MKFKSLGGFHGPKPGRYRSVFIQMIQQPAAASMASKSACTEQASADRISPAK
jgi:hypothetical protein